MSRRLDISGQVAAPTSARSGGWRALLIAAIAAIPSTIIVVGAAETSVEATAQSVMFVAASSSPPSGDAPAVNRLETSGFAVTVVDDHTATPAAAAAYDLVVIGSSVTPSKIDAEFATIATPIVTWEGYVYGTLQLTSGAGGNQGESSPSRTIDIVDPSHPIAAGLSGRPVITSANTAQAYGRPAGSAHVIAAITGQRANAAIFTYDTGDQMFSLAAPARRVGLPLSYGSPPPAHRERVGDLRRRVHHLGAR